MMKTPLYLLDSAFRKEPSDKITDKTENGKCSNCGSCCTDYVIISEKEIKSIKKWLKHHPEVEDKTFSFLCPFRDPVKRCCQIYPVRPNLCRSFKCNKSLEEIKSDKIKESLLENVLNVDVGKMASFREIFKLRKQK